MSSTVAILGELPRSRETFAAPAWKHGWTLFEASTAEDLKRASEQDSVLAVFMNPANVDKNWEKALAVASEAAPEALVVVCCPFDASLPWNEMADGGAFHFLRFPFRESEVRQALGFVWAAKHPRMVVIPAKKSQARRRASVA